MSRASVSEPIEVPAEHATFATAAVGDITPAPVEITRPSVGGLGAVAWGVPVLLYLFGVLTHRLLAPGLVGWDTGWFAAVGFFFLLITAASHAVLCRSSAADPVVAILGSMGIRLAGTFAILGGLIFFSPLGRPEAVFNVLFWYITLTVWDLSTVAWRRMPSSGVQGVSEQASDQTRGTAT